MVWERLVSKGLLARSVGPAPDRASTASMAYKELTCALRRILANFANVKVVVGEIDTRI